MLRRPPETSGGRPRPQGARERTLLERGALHGIQELFKKEGLEFNESDLPTLKLSRPETPPFPILIFMMAVMKDIVDIFVAFPDLAGLTVIGAILTVAGRIIITGLTFITALVIWIWMLGRISGMARLGIRGAAGGVGLAMKTKFVKKRVAQGTIALVTESILPYIPFSTIFVLLAHHDENKYVQLFLGAAEQLGKAIKGGKIKMPGT